MHQHYQFGGRNDRSKTGHLSPIENGCKRPLAQLAGGRREVGGVHLEGNLTEPHAILVYAEHGKQEDDVLFWGRNDRDSV